jgi:hypothetical protein
MPLLIFDHDSDYLTHRTYITSQVSTRTTSSDDRESEAEIESVGTAAMHRLSCCLFVNLQYLDLRPLTASTIHWNFPFLPSLLLLPYLILASSLPSHPPVTPPSYSLSVPRPPCHSLSVPRPPCHSLSVPPPPCHSLSVPPPPCHPRTSLLCPSECCGAER